MKTFTGYWNKVLNYGTSQKGVVLVVVTLALVLLTAIITSAHYTIVSQTTSSSSYRLSTQAFYVAEAGAQRAMDWFSHNYSPIVLTGTTATYPPTISGSNITFTNINGSSGNYPSSAVRTSFQNYLGLNTATSGTPNNFQIVTGTGGSNPVTGQYIVTATLLSAKQIKVFPGIDRTAEKWRIDSTGRLLNGTVELARADNSTIIETLVTPAVNNAVCVKDSFDFNGQVPVDSYDTTINQYGAGSPANSGGTANIGSFANPAGPFTISGPSPSFSGSISIPSTRTERPSICGKGGQGCASNLCDVPDVVPFVETVSYPPSNTTSGGIPATLVVDSTSTPTSNFYKAASCPTNCLVNGNLCDPSGVVTNTTYGTGAAPRILGPIIQTITGQGGNGSRIGLPSGFSGDACLWVSTIDFDNGSNKKLVIDNLTNRTGTGALNIFVSNVDVGGQDLNVLSNKNNPVNIYVRSSFDIQNGNANMNTSGGTGTTGQFAPTYSTQNTQGLKIFGKSRNASTGMSTTGPTMNVQGNARVTAIIYAPRTDFLLSGTSGVFGAVISQVFRKNGNPDGVHYDVQLSKDFVNIFNFVPANQIRRIR